MSTMIEAGARCAHDDATTAMTEQQSAQQEQTHAELRHNIEELLLLARPRLLNVARKYGVPGDAADDIAQETLLEAWRHLANLRDPERFDAWLNGICHNVCRRWSQTRSKETQRQERLPDFSLDEAESDQQMDIPDPLALDPAEELSRQDLAVLLDRAMQHLSESARIVLDLCYLAEMPQQEAAARLGLNINTLDVRLHRARRQLHQVFHTTLRADAEQFGLILDQDTARGWRETSIWCMFCARDHLQGLLEPQPDGRVDLLMRCLTCQRQWVQSGAMSEIVGISSFRTALKRVNQVAGSHWASAQRQRTCYFCHAPISREILPPGESLPWLQVPWEGFRLVVQCRACRSYGSIYLGGLAWIHPAARQFIAQHPRWLHKPEQLVAYAGQPAFRARLADIASADTLTFFLHADTLEILAHFQE